MTNTTERIQKVFQDVFDDETIKIHPEMTANDLEDWDSLTHVLLIIAIENEFKIKFNTAEVVGLKNVGEFIALVEKKLI